MPEEQNTYDQYASKYAALVAKEPPLQRELIVPALLNYLGTVRGQTILDAGCGEGHIARRLYQLGAKVTAVDISPRLIAIAKQRSVDMPIDFKCVDLSDTIPAYFVGAFDIVVSNMVLDDVPGYIGFIRNIGRVSKKQGRVVITKNNPYSAVYRGKVKNYFNSGSAVLYAGLSSCGVKVYYYHRTLEEYVMAFRDAGFYLTRLSDLKPGPELEKHEDPAERERYKRFYRLPFLMALEFSREDRSTRVLGLGDER